MFEAGDVSVPRAWVLGVGLMLALTTVPTSAQAAKMVAGPCVKVGTTGAGVGECNYGGGGSSGDGGGNSSSSGTLSGGYPIQSGSSAFPVTEATAVGEDARVMLTTGDDVYVSWSFDEDEVEADVSAFHLQRGMDPTLPETMDRVAILDPSADGYFDEDGLTSGDAWYVVTAQLANGDVVDSRPFRVNGIYSG